MAGGGNSALDPALQLSRLAEKVCVLTIEGALDGDEIGRRQVLESPRVEVRTSARAGHPRLHLRGGNRVLGRGMGGVAYDNNHTSLPGLLAAGDVTNVQEKQIIIAAGKGARAALSAYAWLVGRGEAAP